MLFLGSWAAAPAPGCIAAEAWWDSPADSEDAGKPPRTQVTAAGDMKNQVSHVLELTSPPYAKKYCMTSAKNTQNLNLINTKYKVQIAEHPTEKQ